MNQVGEPVTKDPRIASAEAVLREVGLMSVSVRVLGHEREIAALSAPGELWGFLLSPKGVPVSRRLKALGFRYVTLDFAGPG